MIIKYINKKEENLDLQKFNKQGFSNICQIYSFTTENIAGYFKYLNFKNKNILTVSASGDHIINSLYKGAKTVTAFDINYLALIYTEMKLVALEQLSYKEFIEFFMINKENDIDKNEKVLEYKIYKEKIRKFLSKDTIKYWDIIYKTFNNDGYKLRNSYIFNNKYDNNDLKINSNLYLKNEKEYNRAKEKTKQKEIILINSDFKNIKEINLPNQVGYDITLMSNISDYIKSIYKIETNYLEAYIKEIRNNFKNKANIIVCAYLYNIENTQYRSEIDNPILRKNVFDKLNIIHTEKSFKSVMKGCTDSVIII